MKSYKIILWGFGSLGQANLRTIVTRPEFEVVGVLGFNPNKVGKDAGELIGLAPIGVRITGDKEALFALKADVVLHSCQDAPDQTEIDADVIKLLESGKNVISSMSYYYPPMRGAEYSKRLDDACKKGGASLHGSGANPGTIIEKIALTQTGYCTQLDFIKVQEIVDFSLLANPAIMAMAGFGLKPEQVDSKGPVMEIVHRYYRDPFGLIAKKIFGADVDRVRVDCTTDFELAEKDFELPGIVTIPKGNVKSLIHRYKGYLDGNEKPFMEIEEFWYLTLANCPIPGVTSQSYYVILVEGKPVSTEIRIDAKASILENRAMHPNDSTLPIWYVAGVSMLQAIPVVCSAKPGFVFSDAFTHCTDYFHKLEKH